MLSFNETAASSAKTFTTSCSEKTSFMCDFCKKQGHTLNECRKIMERPVVERGKFVQLEKWWGLMYVMGKTRVAPMKVTTIRGLELSAVVATRTGDLLKRELKLDGICEYYWTDPKVVLGYVTNDARRFYVFVANRIQQIRSSNEPSQWRYVASEQNLNSDSTRGNLKSWTGLLGQVSYGKKNFPKEEDI